MMESLNLKVDCVSFNEELRNEVIQETHCSKYIIHPRIKRMYHDMERKYWWRGMKNNVTEIVAKCLVCQQIKFER